MNFVLVDSGGQYLDGTTDITRTFHYGNPTPKQVKEIQNFQIFREINSGQKSIGMVSRNI